MNSVRRLVLNSTLLGSGRVVTMALGLGTVAVLTRHLGPYGFGEYTTVLTYLWFCSVIADAGLNTLLVREISREPARTQVLLRSSLGFKAVWTMATLAVALGVSRLLPYSAAARSGILLAAGGTLCMSLQGVPAAFFQARLRMGALTLGEVLAATVQFGIVVWLTGRRVGLPTLLLAPAVGSMINLAVVSGLAWRCMAGEEEENNRGSRRQQETADTAGRDKGALPTGEGGVPLWLTLAREAWPLGLAGMLTSVYARLDLMLLSVMATPTAVGLYGAAYRVIEAVLSLSSILMRTLFPMLAAVSSDRPALLRRFQRAAELNWIVLVPLLLIVLFGADEIVVLAGGPGMRASAAPLRVLMLATVATFTDNLFAAVITVLGRQRYFVLTGAGALALNLALNLLLIPRYGTLGAAWATFATEAAAAVVLWTILRVELRCMPSAAPALKVAAAGLGMAVLLGGVPRRFLLLGGLAGLWLYVALLIATNVIRRDALCAFVGAKRGP
jgi:O-antigen/teichoic acid export membrane protein